MFTFSISLAVGGCWRTATTPGNTPTDRQAVPAPHSEAGALLACRLPIQQRGMTGTGLQALHQRMRRQDFNVALLSLWQLERRLAVTRCAPAPSGLARGRGQPAVATGMFGVAAGAWFGGSVAARRPVTQTVAQARRTDRDADGFQFVH